MKPESGAPGPRYAALLQLLRTAENLWNSSRVFLGRWDLSPSQFNVLNLLRDEPGGLSQIGDQPPAYHAPLQRHRPD